MPALSVVLVADRWETIEGVVEALRRQSVSHVIEMVVVTEAANSLGRGLCEMDDFRTVRVVEAGPDGLAESARTRGVDAATAPVVFVGETHAFPVAGWAEALLEAHREWDVVVPAFGNANPGTALSWAAFLQDYGSCGEGRPAGEPNEWPGFNVSYRRELLESFGDDLDAALEGGDELRRGVRDRGGRVFFTPDAGVLHLNVDRVGHWVWERFLRGLLIARTRRGAWSWPRRLAYALACPAIALVLLRRNVDALRWASRSTRLPRGTVPAWFVGVLVRTVGEAVGYVFGAGERARAAMDEYEIHKAAYVRPPARGP